MRRYARLYAHFLRFSFSRAMEFRVDFFFRIAMDVFWNAVNLAFFWLLYRHTHLLGGWNFDQVFVFTASFFVVDAVHMSVFSNNMWWFPQLVNRGDLDYYLVRPVSPLFFVSLREFAANSFVNLLVALGILVWALARYPAPLPAPDLAIYLALLACGCFLYYVVHMTFLIPVFWLHQSGGLRETFWVLTHYFSRPHGVFRGVVRIVLRTVLPFAAMASLPTQALVEGPSAEVALNVAGVTALAFAFMTWLWRRGLRAYASASS
jgi:ABC-2 type transport system permease protein